MGWTAQPPADPQGNRPAPIQPGEASVGTTARRLMSASTPRFGFVAFAETWNGRLAMLGFVIGLATELLTGRSILQQLGLG
ncbi:MAG: hypothetical protein RLZZ124_41 [Cyanobacteriota bacterium]